MPIPSNIESIRERFKKKFADNTYTNIVAAGPKEVSKWWLSEFSSLLDSISKEVEGERAEGAEGEASKFNYEEDWYKGYNQALSDVLSIIKRYKEKI